MKSNNGDNNVNASERVVGDNAVLSGGDSFSVEETETDMQEELTRQIEVETSAPPAPPEPD